MILSPDFGFGGAERSAAAISLLLSTSFQIHFVVFNRKIKQVYKVGGTIHSLEVDAGKTIFLKLLFFIRRIRRLKRLKQKLRIDVCLSLLEGADYINVLSKGSEKVILSLRGSKKFDPKISGILGWLRKSFLIPKIYSKANALTAVSEGIKNELVEEFDISKKKPFFIVPNFYNVKELQSNANEKLSDFWDFFFASNQTITTVGRISYEKGLDRLIPVFKKILEIKPNTKWVIIGDGPYRKEIVARLVKEKIHYSEGIDNIDISASVFFVGYQANPQKWVGSSTVFVLSSITEGFPNALLEAMALGVPVVAADCPYGPSDILGDVKHSEQLRTYGILLPLLRNEESIIDCWSRNLVDLLVEESLRQEYSSQAIARSKHYSTSVVGQLWHEVLLKTLNEEKNISY